MIVAVIDTIRFKLDSQRHSVFYAENCKRLEQHDWLAGVHTFKAVLAESNDDAISMLRKQLEDWMGTVVWGKVDPKDFTFSFRFTHDLDKGRFWLFPNISDCCNYPVAA